MMKRSLFVSILLITIIIPIYFSHGSKEYSIFAGSLEDLSANSAEEASIFLPFVLTQTPFFPDVVPFATDIIGLTDVTGIVDPGDRRLFVANKEGRIRIVNADGSIEPELLLDISDRVYSSGYEVGLLGLAVHPDFDTNGFIYVYFSRLYDNELYSELNRYFVSNSGTADPQSEQNLLRIHEPNFVHQAGALEFGPKDGYLYIATGDGGTPFDESGFSQSLQSLHGKILRIDVDQGSPYAIPSDNPFANDPEALGEIWVNGLRNPWRFTFDSKTGDMYIGDVGDAKWEEIDFIPYGSGGGQNFGWPCFEGDTILKPEKCSSSIQYTMPIFTYAHNQDIYHCSVTGGYVYHGTQLPELDGAYLFADLCGHTIWALVSNDQSAWQATRWTHFNQFWTTFGERSDGELFLGEYMGDTVYQLTRGKGSP